MVNQDMTMKATNKKLKANLPKCFGLTGDWYGISSSLDKSINSAVVVILYIKIIISFIKIKIRSTLKICHQF
jgi:hypothetical protein